MITTGGATLSIGVPNRLDAIAAAADKLGAFCEQHGVPPATIQHLHLALDEALTNTFSYAWPDGGDHEASVMLHVTRRAVEAEVSDDGVAFNPLDVPPPDLDADLDERMPGGLGVHFIRTLMDSVSYRREEGRNVLTLCKLLPTAEGSTGGNTGPAR